MGDRAGPAGQADRDQRPVRRLPGRAWPPEALTPIACGTRARHLTEDGVDHRRFIQEAVGHRCDTSTAIYMHVSRDFMDAAVRKALAPAFGGQVG